MNTASDYSFRKMKKNLARIKSLLRKKYNSKEDNDSQKQLGKDQ